MGTLIISFIIHSNDDQFTRILPDVAEEMLIQNI